MYDKRYIGVVLIRKAALPGNWVRWTHHMEGKTHCEVCLKLDGCWFCGVRRRHGRTIPFATAHSTRSMMRSFWPMPYL